eukprot:7651616-Pyramimonas_sp.AAC.1
MQFKVVQCLFSQREAMQTHHSNAVRASRSNASSNMSRECEALVVKATRDNASSWHAIRFVRACSVVRIVGGLRFNSLLLACQ